MAIKAADLWFIVDFCAGCRFCAGVIDSSPWTRPQAWPWTPRGFLSHLACKCRIPQEEQQSRAAERDIWKVLISLLPHWQAAYAEHREKVMKLYLSRPQPCWFSFLSPPFVSALSSLGFCRCFSMSSRDRQCWTRRTESSRRTWIPTKRKNISFLFSTTPFQECSV